MKYLNFWFKWQIILRAFGYGVGVFLYTIVPFILLKSNFAVGAASIVALIATTVSLMRNRIVKALALGKKFDRIYRLQTAAEKGSFLTNAGTLLTGMMFLYLTFKVSPDYGLWALTAIGAFLWIGFVSDLFDTIFAERKLAILCLRNYLHILESGFSKMHVEQIARGLAQLEKTLSQDGVIVPHFELAFAINVARLTTTNQEKLRERVENLADVLEHPENTANVSKAVLSSQELLANSKRYTDMGMQVYYPLRKRILSSSTLEKVGALTLILSTAGPIIFYLLHLAGLLS